MKSRTYVAFSTENLEMNGISILALADTAGEADERGRKELPGGTDMRATTWLRNFAVRSESALKATIGSARYEQALDVFLAKQDL